MILKPSFEGLADDMNFNLYAQHILFTTKNYYMKTIWVATLNAGKFKIVFQFVKNWEIILLTGLLLLAISCTKSDDLETMDNELPVDNESSANDEIPTDDETTVDENSLIIYTDIEPDFSGENPEDSYELDLNNDQIIDFTISLFNDNGREFLLIASNTVADNRIMSVAPWYTYSLPLSADSEILNLSGTGNGKFYAVVSIISSEDCFENENSDDCQFDWSGKEDRYLGLRLNIDGHKHSYYGWARLSVTTPNQWIIKDYAYNVTPNSTILAGQVE